VREKMKQEVFTSLEKERTEFKEKMNTVIIERNKYREMISTRKDKDRALQDLIA
jgi:hypothetical protein